MFLRAPLNYRRISSVFQPDRSHPVHGDRRPHEGIDYAADTGTPVRATASGVVEFADRRGGYGNMVDIDHNQGYRTRYAHLQQIDIHRGQRVEQGQVIGTVGMTGTATGPHLHYEVHRQGTPVNPEDVDVRPQQPLEDKELETFQARTTTVRNSLVRLASLAGSLEVGEAFAFPWVPSPLPSSAESRAE